MVSCRYYCITQATNPMLSRMHQTTFSNSMTLLWILFAGECRNYVCVFMNLHKAGRWCLMSFLCFPSGVMRMCATRKWRNWRAITLPHHPGEIDPSRSPLCCLRGWRMACLLRERLRSGWRWSWRTGRWTLLRTESNSQPTIGQEMNGMKTWTSFLFHHTIFLKTFCV